MAGAAEEILGKKVKFSGKKNALLEEVELQEKLNEIFPELMTISENDVIRDAIFARNKVKHLDAKALEGLLLDDKLQAEYMLIRAIRNYEIIGGKLSPSMVRFKRVYEDAV